MSVWKEIHTATRSKLDVSREKEASFNEELKGLPKLQQEADQGLKPIKPVTFQPVMAADLFEAEFGSKDNDILFHFWPWDYHARERESRVTPRFKKEFAPALHKVMSSELDPLRIEIKEDRDIGAWFVRAIGYGSGTFYRELSIKVINALYKELGGE